MGQANFMWGAPRIHGELKLGIEVAPSTAGKYLRSRRNPPSQIWRTFLTNHKKQTASMDFFTVPTATFRVLFVLIVLSHDRRRVMHFNVTDHPSEEWTAQQIREAFPWEAPKYLIRDRDAIFGREFVAITKSMGIEEVVTAPRSPWQNPYVERLIGSIRRECLDHVFVWNETSLADSEMLFSLLREVSHAFSPGERRPGAESRRQTGERSYRCHSSGGTVSHHPQCTHR